MVHRREIDNEPVRFGNQGALWGNAMTWFDHDTGSVWSQPLGEAILGPRSGERLELLSSSLSTWADWQERHPATLALDVGDGGSRLDLDRLAVVVEFGEESMAFPIPELRKVGAANERIGGIPVVVVAHPDNGSWAVLSRTLDDEVIELDLIDTTLVERGGDRRYDPELGTSLDGGPSLDPLAGFTSFPADYAVFFPGGAFWTTDGIVPVS